MIPPRESPAGGQRLAGQEALLLDYVQKLERHRAGRRAVLIHMSGLQPQHRREHHIRIAINSFDPVVRQFNGQLFMLSNSDLMFIFKDTALDETEAVIVKLRFMFSDDPLLIDEGKTGNTNFIDWFALSRDYNALLHFAQRAVGEMRQRDEQNYAKSFVAAQAAPPAVVAREPLTPAMLHKMQEVLERADLSNMLRRQSISAVVGRAAPQPVFSELFISIADLRETLLPEVNLASSPWLFQELTETLDRRVLSLLNKHDDRTVAGDVSINLNVQTLLSPDFLVFDDNLNAGMRGTIVVELQIVDIFADLGGFLFARDFAHDRGYRICLDGAVLESLPFIDRGRLGIDLVKLAWSPTLAEGTLPNGVPLAEYVQRCGPSRIILNRCDTQEAVDFGQASGITLFQGRHIEALISVEARKSKGLLGRLRKR
jgi:hypothetical protein